MLQTESRVTRIDAALAGAVLVGLVLNAGLVVDGLARQSRDRLLRCTRRPRRAAGRGVIATAIIVVSLALDTFAVSLGLGLGGLPRSHWPRVGLLFACCEGMMPAVGLLIGQRLGAAIGEIATYGAAAILILVGALELREAVTKKDNDDDNLAARLAQPDGPPSRLLLVGLSVSLDELAIGFTLGVLGVPLGPALAYIAVQAFAVTFLGLALGRRLGTHIGERAEVVAGIVLLLLGIALVVSEATGRHFL